ncbi:hypothetical protein GCM10010123_14240 [Pilimelia anulata]|uniref:HTH cro/C1-type domain-containing protein n=1 Tax=Pilimelia anulata TaxID=53371 RepID=A0A8J3B128_9ACTN|nr:helix-turn-helix transcriptional regulator [Pilimelia anulata]GGJ85752.1 hypothetical protein GCM10010123_14240 [Pilimelia anulata]
MQRSTPRTMNPAPFSAVAEARRDLGARLRQVRRSAGLTGRTLAALCGIHYTRLSRLEHGHQVPTEQNIRDWCQHCSTPALAPELIAALRAVDGQYLDWQTRVKGGMKGAGGPGARTLYQRTTTFRIHEPLIVPGILQIDAYMRGALAFLHEFHGGGYDLDEAMELRRQRAAQALRPSKRIAVVLFEEALRARYCGPEDHERQLVHLLAVMDLPHVTLGVVPTAVQRYGVSAAAFWMFDNQQVHLGIPSSEIRVTRPQEIELYDRLFAALQERAVHAGEARALIARAICDTQRQAEAAGRPAGATPRPARGLTARTAP